MSLSPQELERYSRQLLMDDWGGQTQERVRASRAIVIGAGALGSPVATYLAAAGVGTIGLVDHDAVELSNLHRQPLYLTPDVDAPKAELAAAKLGLLNPEVALEPYPGRADRSQRRGDRDGCGRGPGLHRQVRDPLPGQRRLLRPGSRRWWRRRSWPSRARCCRIRPGESACYRCVFPTLPAPENRRGCREAGVLGAMAGVVGSLQALEALKLLSGVGTPLTDRLLRIDGLTGEQTMVATSRRTCPPARCQACGTCSA